MLLPFSLNPPAHEGSRDSAPPSAPSSEEPLITPRSPTTSPPPPACDKNALLRMAFTASPLPIVALDAEGRVALWNRAAETTFGWSPSEALGTRPSPELAVLVARTLCGERIFSVATSPTRKDGLTLKLRVSLAQLRSDAGAIEGVMAIFAPA